MPKPIALASTWLAALLLGTAALAAAAPPTRLAELAATVLHGSPAEVDGAVAALRQAGPAGMDAMLAAAEPCLAGSCPGGRDAEAALDRVCGVRDCAAIRLFWYTDLEAAKAAARASGKPILSLRLMGKLDEEFSCANSRFFRTVYYDNREINALLRDRYILHWRSVRPVPKVTIDFGGGTRLERTLTGNSIHYVLDSRGRLLDALPGLSGPEAFRAALEESLKVAQDSRPLNDEQLASWLVLHRRTEVGDRALALTRELAQAGVASAAYPPAATAPVLAASKGAIELRLLDAIAPVNDEQLQALARLRRPRIHLDTASRAFLLRKQGVTSPAEGDRLVDAFETMMALDEVINEYRLGPAILDKLNGIETAKTFDLEAFNEKVYEEVFRTPLSDPWLGLAPADVYSALPAATRTARTPE